MAEREGIETDHNRGYDDAARGARRVDTRIWATSIRTARSRTSTGTIPLMSRNISA